MSIPVSIVVLTYNAGPSFEKFAQMVRKQTADIKQVLVIDSGSNDGTIDIAKKYGFMVEVIDKDDFGHGKTRQYALEKVETEAVVFMTQDALLAGVDSVEKLVDYLNQENIAAVYGRQLPYPDANVLARFARLYNYPEQSHVNSFADKTKRGIKTAFMSDSFAAYRKYALMSVGGFMKQVNFGEDMCAAAKLLMAGYDTAYCADAAVYHSHDFTLIQEFKRSQEIGRFHKQERWLLEAFGKAEGEGLKFVIAEAKYLLECGKWYYLPVAFLHNGMKFLGYKMR